MGQTKPAVPNTALAGPIEQAIEAYATNFAAVLPPDIPLDHFKRIVLTAVSTTPELRSADRRSFFNSCIKCAADGLMPDGRDAALVVYSTKVKDRRTHQERRVDLVQYLPMVSGIRRRMRNTGEVKGATAEVVYRNDTFDYELGDQPFIKHKPPPLGEERGEIVGCYARIELANGEVLRDVMSVADVERARARSRAPNSPMWSNFYGEAAKKTVLKRCGKAAPTASTLQRLLNRDEEPQILPPVDQMQLVPPRPIEEDFEEDFEEETSDSRQPTDAGTAPEQEPIDVTPVKPPTLKEFTEADRRASYERAGVPIEQNAQPAKAVEPEPKPSEEAAAHSVEEAGSSSEADAGLTEAAHPRQVSPTPKRPVAATAGQGNPQNPEDRPPARRRAAVSPNATAAPPQPPEDAPLSPPPQDASYAIPMVVDKNGKPALQTWAVGLLLPALLAAKTPAAVAWIRGDNHEHIDAYKATLGALERRFFEDELARIAEEVGGG